jgi:ATP:ADP antiporter, AAA family
VIQRLIDVRRGEGPLALKAFGALFGLIAGHTILETCRDALFLGTLPASRLTLVYIALAVVGLVVPLYNSRYVRSFGRRNAAVLTLMIAAFGTTVWHFQPATAATAYGLYVWSGLLGTMLIVQFWMFAGQLFTLAQGKRLFPGIASGGVLGAVAGGIVATGTLELMPGGHHGVANLLLVAAGVFMATALLLTTIPTDDVGAPFRAASSELQLTGGLQVLRDHPYVRTVASFVALATITTLAADYLFKMVAKAEVPTAELGSFFARYYAVLNAVALIVQLVLAQRVVHRLGVVAALTLLPLLLATGGVGILVVGGSLTAVMLTKGADGALRHSLHRVATELLYLPLPDDVRDRAKSLIDAVFVRGAQALTAGGLLVVAELGFTSSRTIAGVVAVGAFVWIAVALTMKRSYLDLLRAELGRGALDPRLLQFEELDIDSVESVMVALSSTESARVIGAMQLLEDSGRARLIPALILYHDDEQVLLKALDLVPRIDEQQWRPHAVRLSRSGSNRVRAAALRALGRACEGDLVRPFMDDPSLSVQAHAAFQLARCEGAEEPMEHPAIVQLLQRTATATDDERRAVRQALLDALQLDADARWTDLMLELASEDRSPAVVEAVSTALVRIPDERFIPLLLSWLDLREVRSRVQQALVLLGPPALTALDEALRAPETTSRIRRAIPVTMAGFGSQRAADLLMEHLARETDGVVRYRVLRGLGRLVSSYAVTVDKAMIEEEIERNLREHLRLMALSTPIDDEHAPTRARASAMLLKGLLDDKMRQALERAFRLFKVLHPHENIRGVYIALSSSNRKERANALEFLDALALNCSEECRRLLRLVGDDLPPAEKVARAGGDIFAPSTEGEAVASLLGDSDEGVVALAAYHAMASRTVNDDLDLDGFFESNPSMRFVVEAVEQLPPLSLVPASYTSEISSG